MKLERVVYPMIRHATLEDLNILLDLDNDIEYSEMENIIKLERVLVYEDDGKLIGWLRYNMFWDHIPFLNKLYILKPFRNKGIGLELMNYWETELRAMGHYLAMTSSLAEESAQHFYRKLEYQDAGSFVLPGENLEIIFVKQLGQV